MTKRRLAELIRFLLQHVLLLLCTLERQVEPFLLSSKSPFSSSRWSPSPLQQQQQQQLHSSDDHPHKQEEEEQLRSLYQRARYVRCTQGHDAACRLYQSLLLQHNPADITAATRLAASLTNLVQQALPKSLSSVSSSQRRRSAVDAFRQLLQDSHYTSQSIGRMLHGAQRRRNGQDNNDTTDPDELGDDDSHLLNDRCPLYLTPAAAGTTNRWPFFLVEIDNNNNDTNNNNNTACSPSSRLSCLVALFLLGLAVPQQQLRRAFATNDTPSNNNTNHQPSGGDVVQLLWHDLGLVHPCAHQPHLLLPLVSIVPIDLHQRNNNKSNNNNTTLWIATDWHPRVLSTTDMGSDEQQQQQQQAVMYIGPDSLALVEHWTLMGMDDDQRNKKTGTMNTSQMDIHDDNNNNNKNDVSCNNNNSNLNNQVWLDLCTGSGIQALAALCTGQCRTAVGLDTNPRALRFSRFNAQLNGVDPDRLLLVQGDLLTNKGKLFVETMTTADGDGVADRTGDKNDKSTIHGSSAATADEPLVPLLQRLAASITHEKKHHYDVVIANPPFVPIPPGVSQARHGLFSAGGPTGELVLAAVLDVAQQVLWSPSTAGNHTPDDGGFGYCAIVSEFFFVKPPPSSEHGDGMYPPSASHSSTDSNGDTISDSASLISAEDFLLQRLESYWLQSATPPTTSVTSTDTPMTTTTTMTNHAKMLLLTNEYPISANTYAQRRADSAKEFRIWMDHLSRQHIVSCSPGLLYMKTSAAVPAVDATTARRRHVRVPKSNRGSIWTPSNSDAIQFTQRITQECLFGNK